MNPFDPNDPNYTFNWSLTIIFGSLGAVAIAGLILGAISIP